ADVARKADNGKDHVGPLGQAPWRVGPAGAGVKQWLGFALAAIKYRGRVAFRHQVPAHGKAHDARANPANARLAGYDRDRCHDLSSLDLGNSRTGTMVANSPVAGRGR